MLREKLENSDINPSDQVWDAIASTLDEKKKKRRAFIWLFGLVFLLGLITTAIFFNQWNTTNSDNKNRQIGERDSQATKTTETAAKNPAGLQTKKTTDTSTENQSGPIHTAGQKNPGAANQNQSALSHSSAQSNNLRRAALPSTSKKAKLGLAKTKQQSSGTAYAQSKSSSQTYANNEMANANTNSQGDFNKQQTNMVAKDTTRPGIDTLKTDAKKKNRVEDSLAVKDSTIVVDKKPRTIIISPYYGINYGGYLGEFNGLSNNRILENKGKTRQIYGIMARWMFTDRLGIQTGLGKIDNRQFTTIEKTDYPFINTQNVETDMPYNDLMGIFANETRVKFTYQNSYIEVPLEAYYTVRDKKLGVATAFGVSLLFAGKNAVFAESENVPQLKIGKLITDTEGGFTANAKLYLFYKITPELQLDLYPSFQYRLMGDTDSDYSRYFLSLRTGISYKF